MKLIWGRTVVARFESPPARGAWIEINIDREYRDDEYVAPRTGGVD